VSRARLTAGVVTNAVLCAAALVAGAVGPLAPNTGAAQPPAAISPRTTSASGAAVIHVGRPLRVARTPAAQGFLGIATSLSTIPILSGSATDPDIPFRHLLSNLSPGAPMLLRLGGVSADTSWWAVRGIKKPPYLYTLTPRWGGDVHSLLNSLGARAILGVNLQASPRIEPTVARVEVAEFERYLGASRIDAFELGNEPEREVGTTIAGYGKQFSHIASMLGGAPLAGPASVGSVWLRQLGTVLNHLPTRLKLVTVHAYPLKKCSSRAHLSMSDLFTHASIQGLANSIHRMVKAATSHAKPLRVDEINAITCGGQAGLSDSFGEALWALNVLPALWRAGVQGVNFQTVDGGLNQMITATHPATGWRISVQPEYYGLLAFADAAPAGSQLLHLSSPRLPDFYQFAVRAPDRSERVVLTNIGAVARTIDLVASHTDGTASMSLLSARSLKATGGTTLGGQYVSSHTGQLTGRHRATPLQPNSTGVYRAQIPARTAAIITLSAAP
jgi:hypothetical protein